MAFRIVAKPRAWWDVVWPGVNEDGSIGENSIKLRFILHKRDDSVDLEVTIQEKMKTAQAARDAGDDIKVSAILADTLKMFAEDWKGVLAENEDPLPWNDTNLQLLMNEPGVFEWALKAYRGCMAASPEIREGN